MVSRCLCHWGVKAKVGS